MSRPEFIIFTGVDEMTSIDGMEALSRAYPIEWGVLFSPNSQGVNPRYPHIGFMRHLVANTTVRLAAHLCGEHARRIIAFQRDPSLAWMPPRRFGRIQINTTMPILDIPVTRVANWVGAQGARLILQCRKDFPSLPVCDWLFDKSGGKGISPLRWPRPTGRLVGYAGGLGPEIIASQLPLISGAVPYWLDMETNIRTNDRLDLAKCRKVCEIVYG